jgi:crotonobetainyl-CoA:carnitine CoA-transferase CaiB-like acyl-CoA transferase
VSARSLTARRSISAFSAAPDLLGGYHDKTADLAARVTPASTSLNPDDFLHRQVDCGLFPSFSSRSWFDLHAVVHRASRFHRPGGSALITDTAAASSSPAVSGFDSAAALEDLLADVELSIADAGGRVTFAGQDPIIAARHRLGAAIGIPMMGNAAAAAAMHRHRGGRGQDLHLDLRQAVHHINPSFGWEPTLAGEFPSIALFLDNPFSLIPYRTRDGRTVMASAGYPHQVAEWCRFLDVPPDFAKVAEAFASWDAFELEEAANATGLPACVARSPQEWLAHPHGALLANQPVIGLTRIGDAPPRELGPSDRPFGGLRVLSFTHTVAGPTVGRVLAEQGADVLGATRPNDFEHDCVYFEASIGSRSAWLDLTKDTGKANVDRLLRDAHIVVNNHRGSKLEKLGIDPHELARSHPGLVHVSVTCYGSDGPWAHRGGFDMNGSAASGLMVIEGGQENPQLPTTGLINDFITGYMGALGAAAGLMKQQTEGGSWHVTVNLTATPCGIRP